MMQEPTATTAERVAEDEDEGAWIDELLSAYGHAWKNAKREMGEVVRLFDENTRLRKQLDAAEPLLGILPKLGVDELRVLRRIGERLAMGREQYGELQIAKDRRNWVKELLEELLDASVYAAVELEKGGK